MELILDTFSSDGWNKLNELLTKANQNEKDFAHIQCDTNEKWHYTRGHIAAYEEILNLPKFVEAYHEDLNEQEKNPDEVTDWDT